MKKSFLINLAMFFVFGFSVAQGKVNILSPEYYGFEVASGDDGWWMQQPENWSIVTNKGANGTLRSLKYTNDADFTGSKKAFGSSTISDMLINLEAGDYELKAMIWVESSSASISKIRANFRTDGKSDVNINLDVSSIAKDEWVEVVVPFTLSESFESTNVRIMMDSSTGAIGTFYFDELQLLVDEEALPKEVPFTSQISTTEDENITLPAGTYQVSLQVWIEDETTIPSFYTQIIEPWNSIEWDLGDLEREQWVEIKKEVLIGQNVEDSKFQIFVSNFSNGVAYKGRFYVDAIVFTLTEALSNPDFDIKAVGETCEGEKNGRIEIGTATQGAYFAVFNGDEINFSEETIIEGLSPGSYELKIGSAITTELNEYTVTVPQSQEIKATLVSLADKTQVEISQGTAPYTVYKNGEKVAEFTTQIFELKSEFGDVIEMETSVPCEGKFSNLENLPMVYPNPAENYFNVMCPAGSQIRMFSASGKRIKKIDVKQANPRIDLSDSLSGVFYLEVVIGSKSVVKKVVVK